MLDILMVRGSSTTMTKTPATAHIYIDYCTRYLLRRWTACPAGVATYDWPRYESDEGARLDQTVHDG